MSESVNCPQCGSSNFEPGKECLVCGFNPDLSDDRPPVQVKMSDDRRDVMNGIGLGCSGLAMIWFFVETAVFGFASHDPRTWSYYGPLISVVVPVVIVAAIYFILQRTPTKFSKGVGYSLLISFFIFALGAFALHATDNKPPANGAHSEGF